MIKLTTKNYRDADYIDVSIWVNPMYILYIEEYIQKQHGWHSRVITQRSMHYVSETPEQILELIKQGF